MGTLMGIVYPLTGTKIAGKVILKIEKDMKGNFELTVQ